MRLSSHVAQVDELSKGLLLVTESMKKRLSALEANTREMSSKAAAAKVHCALLLWLRTLELGSFLLLFLFLT